MKPTKDNNNTAIKAWQTKIQIRSSELSLVNLSDLRTAAQTTSRAKSAFVFRAGHTPAIAHSFHPIRHWRTLPAGSDRSLYPPGIRYGVATQSNRGDCFRLGRAGSGPFKALLGNGTLFKCQRLTRRRDSSSRRSGLTRNWPGCEFKAGSPRRSFGLRWSGRLEILGGCSWSCVGGGSFRFRRAGLASQAEVARWCCLGGEEPRKPCELRRKPSTAFGLCRCRTSRRIRGAQACQVL
jgi:hypothetical protein